MLDCEGVSVGFLMVINWGNKYHLKEKEERKLKQNLTKHPPLNSLSLSLSFAVHITEAKHPPFLLKFKYEEEEENRKVREGNGKESGKEHGNLIAHPAIKKISKIVTMFFKSFIKKLLNGLFNCM